MRKIIPVVVAGVAALAVAGSAFGYVTLEKDITLSVDGAPTEVSTFAGTVGDVLAKEGIEVGKRDVVAPAVDTKIADGTEVAVQFARQVTVNVDGEEQAYWTTATSVDEALETLKIKAEGADLSTSRSTSIGRDGLSLDIATLKNVELTVAGKKKDVKTTGQTVADALEAAKVHKDKDDKLSAKPTDKLTDGAKITYVKVDQKKVTKEHKISFGVQTKKSSSLAKGTTKVEREGKTGSQDVVSLQVKHDGKVVKTKKLSTKVTAKPSDKILLVGTKEKAPTPKKKDSSDSGSGSDSDSGSDSGGGSGPAVPSGSVWDDLAQCEAGGNWSINTGNGFYGGLQFTKQTWSAFGGSGMPHENSREAQIAVGKKVQAGQGWGAWPACASKLGLR
ncbi:MAG: ubiquitin-like domain-containing protein [Propionibacteriaceae bacterium]